MFFFHQNRKFLKQNHNNLFKKFGGNLDFVPWKTTIIFKNSQFPIKCSGNTIHHSKEPHLYRDISDCNFISLNIWLLSFKIVGSTIINSDLQRIKKFYHFFAIDLNYPQFEFYQQPTTVLALKTFGKQRNLRRNKKAFSQGKYSTRIILLPRLNFGLLFDLWKLFLQLFSSSIFERHFQPPIY